MTAAVAGGVSPAPGAGPAGHASPLREIERAIVERRGEATFVRVRTAVNPADRYLIGHFPGLTIFPGVFVLELLHHAVVAGVAAQQARSSGVRLTGLRSVRFLAPVGAFDWVTLEAELSPAGHGAIEARAVSRRGDGVVTSRITAEFAMRDGG